MHFVIYCRDKTGALETRLAARADHLVYLDERKAAVVAAGPLLDDKGDMCGSLLILDVADQAAAEAFAAGDPYAKAGLFASVEIRPWRWSINPPKA